MPTPEGNGQNPDFVPGRKLPCEALKITKQIVKLVNKVFIFIFRQSLSLKYSKKNFFFSFSLYNLD